MGWDLRGVCFLAFCMLVIIPFFFSYIPSSIPAREASSAMLMVCFLFPLLGVGRECTIRQKKMHFCV